MPELYDPLKDYTGPIVAPQTPRFSVEPARHKLVVPDCPRCGGTRDYPEYGCGEQQALEVIEWAQAFGYELDPWQEWSVTNILATKPDGHWAAPDVLIIVSRQNGKGPEALSNKVYTQRGWVTFSEIVPDDSVLGSDGRFTKVLYTSPVFPARDCYEVEFTDGAKITVAAEHLWHVRGKNPTEQWRDVSTEELAKSVGGRRADNGRMEYNWRVRCDSVPDLPEAELPVEPYLLGYWLGDGTHKSARVTIGAEDLDWSIAQLERAGAACSAPVFKGGESTAYDVAFRIADAWSPEGFLPQVRALGVWGAKHIPEMYMTASIAQRKALLAGLMDSDGSIMRNNKTPQCEFTTSIPALADDFHRLARSLGIRVKPTWRKTAKKDNCRFLFTAPFNPFEMPRKAERWTSPASNRHELMSIVRITPVESVPTRCIKVAAEDGVYLTGELFTPTHNTILEVRELAGMFVLGEEMLIHTAHQFKGLDVRTPVLTANRAWTTMGELRDGDEVYVPDGSSAPITAHPWRARPCYKVTFADGQELVADDEHRWEVTEAWLYNGKTERKVVTTQQMFEAGTVHESKNASGGRKNRCYRWRTDLPAPISRPHHLLPVDPWLLGFWLGDGTSSKGELTVGSEDLTYVEDCLFNRGETYTLRQDPRTGAWTVRVRGLLQRLRALGVLGDKHIPEAYALGSVRQRQELLAGIMDSDGTVTGERSGQQLSVTMIREALMQQVLQLARSLGYRSTFRKFRASLNGKDAGPMYRVQFAPNGTSPFQMPRKTQRIASEPRTGRSTYNAIVSIEPVETVPTRCITVDHPSGCYLAGEGFAVTHNTSLNHFRRLKTTLDNYPALRKRVKRIAGSHGEESIELFSAPTLIFGPKGTQIRRKVAPILAFHARQGSAGGRGFSCDCLVYDESMILSDEQVGASMPSMSERPNPQMIMAGSAGLKDSFAMAKFRKSMIAGAPDMFGYEYSAVPHTDDCPRDEFRGRATNNYIVCSKHDDRDDPAAWLKSNPATGWRNMNLEFTRRELRTLPAEEFDRERLGQGEWPVDDDAWAVISQEQWRKLANEDPGFPAPPLVFAADVDEDGKSATISAAWDHKEGRIVIEIPRGASRHGSDWVFDEMCRLYKKHRPLAMVLPKSGPGAALLEDGKKKWGDRLIAVGPGDEAAAFAWFIQQVKAEKLWHFGEENAPTLWNAVGRADTRVVGDGGKAWSRRDSESDITPITSATLAAYVLNMKRRSYDPMKSIG